MPGSFKGSKPGSHLYRTRARPGGPSRVARLFAFRQVLYARMEEVSFRTSMTVLAGVVAFAAVGAAVSTAASLSPGPARHAALGRPPASAAPSYAPASVPATPAQPAPASPSPSSPSPVTPSPVRDTGSSAGTHAPVTAAAAAASVPTPTLSPSPARVSYQAAVAAWWAWWARVHGGGSDRAGGGSFRGIGQDGGGFGRDRGGFGGGGGGFGRR
jgi:hypothetical protein